MNSIEKNLLKAWNLTEIKAKLLQIAYSATDDECYTKEELIRDLVNVTQSLDDHIPQILEGGM